MNKPDTAVDRARITYFFRETFRAHSKAEYREIFSRGLNEDNEGISGAFPWLYVRAFFALFLLFTINTLILRITNNKLYVPSVNFLGGITFVVPFIILLFELYPKRDLSLIILLAVLVGGGTFAGLLSQIGYMLIPVKIEWLAAVEAGVLEEFCKAVPAIIAVALLKQKNPYACFLIAAAVGVGFSVIEDMGYIFYYSDKYYFEYHSDIQATVMLFFDRGLSSFCTHVLWTGAIGWACCSIEKPLKSLSFFGIVILGVGLHICWDLPVDGWIQVAILGACVVAAASVNISIVHISRKRTKKLYVDEKAANEEIIREAKEMGERMRFTNAANLTFALICTVLAALILLFCAMPIGIDYQQREFSSPREFISYVEGGYKLKVDLERNYDVDGRNVEKRYIIDETTGKDVLTYVIQSTEISGCDGVYFYGYYVNDGKYEQDTSCIAVELENEQNRLYAQEYVFDTDIIWAFDVNGNKIIDYVYHSKDGTVTAATDAEEFRNFGALIIICAVGCAVTVAGTVILVGFTIKLRRLKDEK